MDERFPLRGSVRFQCGGGGGGEAGQAWRYWGGVFLKLGLSSAAGRPVLSLPQEWKETGAQMVPVYETRTTQSRNGACW